MNEDTTQNQTPTEDAADMRKILDTPMPRDEAERSLADIEVQLAQLEVQRLRAVSVVNEIDHQISLARFEQRVIYRRAMNVVDEKPTDEAK